MCIPEENGDSQWQVIGKVGEKEDGQAFGQRAEKGQTGAEDLIGVETRNWWQKEMLTKTN